jgi:predicted amidophosphoribosyltransferase
VSLKGPDKIKELTLIDGYNPQGGERMSEHFVCPDCGPHISADEDGLCAGCGAECKAEPCGCQAEISRLQAENEALRQAARKMLEAIVQPFLFTKEEKKQRAAHLRQLIEGSK